MTGRELGAALFIGAVSGVVVATMAAALSGAPVTGFLDREPSSSTAPQAAGSGGPVSATIVPSESASPTPTAETTAIPSSAPSSPPSSPPPTALTFADAAVKAGLPSQNGEFGSRTPAVARGEYISWQVDVGPEGAGQPVDVEVATRLDGTWTGWSTLTSRVVDADGRVSFSWRQLTPVWISVRFAHGTTVSTALQGRWR